MLCLLLQFGEKKICTAGTPEACNTLLIRREYTQCHCNVNRAYESETSFEGRVFS
jgi:hypothetical protein